MPNNYSKPDEVNVLPLGQMYAEDSEFEDVPLYSITAHDGEGVVSYNQNLASITVGSDPSPNVNKFKMYPSKWIFVTFQREGIHRWPDAEHMPGIEFLAHPHRHMFHFRVELQVFHDDREVEFILFKRELEKQYESGTLQLDYKSCEMMSDELGVYIQHHYPGRFMKIEVSEDGENGAVSYYSGDLND